MISKFKRSSSPYRLTGRLACATLALCAPVAGWAETLADAVASAYDRNPQLVQQRYLQKARDEGYVQARAQYGPSVNAETQGGHNYQRAANFLGVKTSTESDSQTSTVSINQPLYSSGRIRGNVEAATAAVLGGREQLRLTEQRVVEDVIQVYAAVLRDEARLDVGRENLTVLEGQLRQNTKRQQVGDVTLTDVAQSDARVAAAELQLASLEAQLTISRGQYLEVVGHNPGDLEPLPQLAPLPPTIDAAFMLADDNNPALSAAHYVERQSSATSAATRGEQGPTVSLGAQAQYVNRPFRFGGLQGQTAAFAGVTVTQPLWAGGAIRSRIREADARNFADQAGIDIARRQTMQDVTSSWAQLSSARTEVVSGERQVASAQAAFAGMSCEELNGLRATIETLNAEQELQAAQLQLLASRYQVYVSHAALLASVGTLSAQQIADGIHTYDPEANFKRVRFRGATPLDFIAMAIDRIGSAGPRGPVSADLSGANVPKLDYVDPLAPSPGPALMNKPLTPITQSRLRLPDGSLARCPLNDIRPVR